MLQQRLGLSLSGWSRILIAVRLSPKSIRRIEIIAILASLLLPSLNKGKLKAQNLQCMSNHRQLCYAWRMYSEDNQDALLFASEDPYHPETIAASWVTGTLNFNPGNRSNWD